jgi:hypothetical protein
MLTVTELLDAGIVKDSNYKPTVLDLSENIHVIKKCPKCFESVDIHPIDHPAFSTDHTIAIKCGGCATRYAVCLYCGKYVKDPTNIPCKCERNSESFIAKLYSDPPKNKIQRGRKKKAIDNNSNADDNSNNTETNEE